MRVRIFQASGHDEIRGLQKKINDWIMSKNYTIQNQQISMCQVADSPSGERYQYLVVCVWYD